MLDSKDYDTTPLFQEEIKAPKSPLEYQKKRSDRLETEAFYPQVGGWPIAKYFMILRT